jgi:hypothetical protein
LEELYFWHVEHFPWKALPVHVIDELLSVFSHAMTGVYPLIDLILGAASNSFSDHMTSNTSTFFYGKKDCKNFIKALKLAREHPNDPCQISLVARLWKFVC